MPGFYHGNFLRVILWNLVWGLPRVPYPRKLSCENIQQRKMNFICLLRIYNFLIANTFSKVCFTLHHLCTRDAQITIGTSYRISPKVVGRIMKATCKVIWNVLQAHHFLYVPSSKHAWLRIASDFDSKMYFPHCLGEIDGKHIIIQAPGRSGSDYFNYKKVTVSSC